MRSLAEMTDVVQALVHDTTGKTYGATLVAARLRDAHRDLLDRMMADPLASRCLLAVGDATDAAEEVELPAACARLLRVEWYDDSSARWLRLPTRQQCPEPDAPLSLRSSTFEILGTEGVSGMVPLNWRSAEDGASILLHPPECEGTIRLVYLATPAFPAGAAYELDLPEGADELVEYLAADKLCAMEPLDQKRLQTYAALFSARYATWRQGLAAGRVDRTQRYVAEADE